MSESFHDYQAPHRVLQSCDAQSVNYLQSNKTMCSKLNVTLKMVMYSKGKFSYVWISKFYSSSGNVYPLAIRETKKRMYFSSAFFLKIQYKKRVIM